MLKIFSSKQICEADRLTMQKESIPSTGIATAVSGDVLTGIITGFSSYIEDPLVAAISGVYVHGLTGNYLPQSQGKSSMIASDIIANLGKSTMKAFKF